MRGYENLDETVSSAAACGVHGIITVGIDYPSTCRAIAIAGRFPHVWATAGIHPHNVSGADRQTYEQLGELLSDRTNKIVGYGEIGLDYAKKYAPVDLQVKEFTYQISLAKELNLPVIIHDRDAHEDTLRILKKQAPYPMGGVMHCFSGDLKFARRVIDLGFHISIPGIVTFNKSETLQEVARKIPMDHIILETDGPFLAPVPYRGKTNRPEYLGFTAQKVAELQGMTLDEVAGKTTANARSLFNLPPLTAES